MRLCFVFGLCGSLCAGKGTFIEYFSRSPPFKSTTTTTNNKKTLRFELLTCASLSDTLRADLRKIGKEITRDNLIERGNFLRSTQGDGVLAKLALQNAKEIFQEKSKKNHSKQQQQEFEEIVDIVVIDSVRHPMELKELRNNFKSILDSQDLDVHFKFVAIDAPVLSRFARCNSRNSVRNEQDPVSLTEFLQRDDFELYNTSGNTSGQQIRKLMTSADLFVINSSDKKEQFFKQLDQVVTLDLIVPFLSEPFELVDDDNNNKN